jgi:short-subunit dehydrogenase
MNKLAVITGGTRGIGRELAFRFAQEGFNIVIAARNQTELDAMKTVFQGQFSAEFHGFSHDLADKTQAVAFAANVTAMNRSVDILINNAGYFTPGTIASEPDGALEGMINSNLYSAYHVTRGILPIIPKGGHIFNMCSIASFMAYPNGGSYSISKFAMLGFSKVLREELKHAGIRVTALMPGATMTSSWEGVDVAEERLMKPSDIADIVFSAWKLSDRTVVEEIVIRPQLGDL